MPPQKPRKSGRAPAIALSLLLHAAIAAAAIYGWFTWKHEPPPPETLAVEGSVVDERALKDLTPIPAAPPAPEPEPVPEPVPEPEPTPVEPEVAPEPDPAELERLEAERREQERLEAEKQEQEKQEQERQALELKQREEAERLEAEKQAAAKAAAEKAAAEKAAAEKAAAEKKALEKKRADEAAARKAAEEKARLAREAELRRSLEAEERSNAMRNSAQATSWYNQIVARITRAWIRPPSARAGIECKVAVTQVPGGEVTAVRVLSCSIPDPALRESVEAAVYRASPLPPPPDPALFERNLELTFAPQD
jgi:colicin import membrane protein